MNHLDANARPAELGRHWSQVRVLGDNESGKNSLLRRCPVRCSVSHIEFAARMASRLTRLPSTVHVAGGRRPLRAYGEVRAHIAAGEVGATTRPHSTRRPCGRPRLAVRPTSGPHGRRAAGRFAHMVKCARIRLSVSRAPRGPGGRVLNLSYIAGTHAARLVLCLRVSVARNGWSSQPSISLSRMQSWHPAGHPWLSWPSKYAN